MLKEEEKVQYHRHLILDQIGPSGQLKLKAASVLVIGAGGLGCPVLQYLSAAGVGRIGVIDNDMVDQTNLQRQVLYAFDTIGKPKVTCAINRLKSLNPFVRFEGYQQLLDTTNAVSLFEKYDIIVDASDNFPTRYLVSDAAVLTNKPLVFGSIFKFQGQVSVFNFKNGPTYRCLYPTPPAPDSVPNCSEIGVLGVLPGIIGALQANEVLKIITEIGSPLSGKLLYFDALTLDQQLLNFSKNETIAIKKLADDYEFFCGIQKSAQGIDIQTYLAKKERYHLLDVRTDQEYHHFNLEGQHIPLDELIDRVSELPNNKPVVVCCQSGIRSQQAISQLNDLNLGVNFINLEGGLKTY